MNREIKYKYHYTNHAPKVWGLIDIEQGYAKEFVLWNDEVGEVTQRRQFTGLGDNRIANHPIFEGDILEAPEQNERVEVFYHDGAFRVHFSFDDESTVLTEKLIEANWLIKIGDIHNNSELLEQKLNSKGVNG